MMKGMKMNVFIIALALMSLGCSEEIKTEEELPDNGNELVAPSITQSEICNWDSDKKAAVVLTFDDWSPGHYPIVVPELKKRGLVGTFFPIPSNIASWNHPWSAVSETVSYGNEIGNHSKSHPKLSEKTALELSTEIRGTKRMFDENLNSQSVITFAYPFGNYNEQVIDSIRAAGHIAARTVIPPINYTYQIAQTELDYYKLATYAMGPNKTIADFTEQLNKVIKGGGLMTYLYHSVDDAAGSYKDNWYAKVLKSSLQEQFDVLVSRSDDIWVTTLGQAIKYHKEANCAKIKEVKAFDGNSWTIALTDTLSDNNLYNQALTLKLAINDIEFTKIEQNGKSITIDSINEDFIQFKAVPDGGDITLYVAK